MTESRRRHNPETHRNTTLRRANWSEDLETVRRLFQGYRQWLSDHRDTDASADSKVKTGLALTDQQISDLPGAYGPPHGDVILAFSQKALVACGALRELEPKIGEIKRIYVRPDHRGPGFGPRMAGALLRRARALGFERVRVDTLSTMAGAIQFYQEMGFVPIPAYWPHPAQGALYFEFRLGKQNPKPRRRAAVSSKRS